MEPKPYLDKTWADYMVIAISPALIVTLVASFVFFLLSVLYEGKFEGRLEWIFFFFIVGAVGISRISIEEGWGRAILFAVPLAGAVMLAVNKFVDFPFMANVMMIAIIWYSVSKLTWNCTVVDEQEDASGEGLVEQIASGRPRGEAAAPAASDEAWWERFFTRKRKPQAPGLWVIYLSLIALPQFGLLQGSVPQEDAGRRAYGTRLLLVFVGSALGLLLTTSFLALRRYLRKRQLEMPLEMAGVWLATGCVLIASLLLFCSWLPLPSSGHNPVTIAWRMKSPEIGSSKTGKGKEGADKKGEQPSGSAEKGKESGGEKGDKPESSTGEKQGGESGKEKSSDGKEGSGEKAGEQGKEGSAKKEGEENKTGKGEREETGADAEADPRAALAAAGQQLKKLGELAGVIFRWALLAVVILVALIWLAKNLDYVVGLWMVFLQELRAFWAGLFGGRAAPVPQSAATIAAPRPRPFARFEDPFESGMSRRASPDEMVKYSFEALEAWAMERGCERAEHQTPYEFSRVVAGKEKAVAVEAVTVAELYTHAAYAKGSLKPSAVRHLQPLWKKLMKRPAAVAAGADAEVGTNDGPERDEKR